MSSSELPQFEQSDQPGYSPELGDDGSSTHLELSDGVSGADCGLILRDEAGETQFGADEAEDIEDSYAARGVDEDLCFGEADVAEWSDGNLWGADDDQLRNVGQLTDEEEVSKLTGSPDTSDAILRQLTKEELDHASGAGYAAYARDNDSAATRIESTTQLLSRGNAARELGPLVMSKAVLRAPEAAAESLVVNGESIELDPNVVRALGDLLKITDEHEEAGYSVDCAAFAAGLCNQHKGRPAFEAPFRDQQDPSAISQDFDIPVYGPITPESVSSLPTMQPLYLDRGAAAEGKFDIMHHVIVKLPTADGRDMCVEKIGICGPVAVGSLQTIARFYGATHVGIIDRFTLASNAKDEANTKFYSLYRR